MSSFLWEMSGGVAAAAAGSSSGDSDGGQRLGDSSRVVVVFSYYCKWILLCLTGILWRILKSVIIIDKDDINITLLYSYYWAGLSKESPESPEMPSGMPRSISDSFPSEDTGKTGKWRHTV